MKDKRERECGRRFPHIHSDGKGGREDCPIKDQTIYETFIRGDGKIRNPKTRRWMKPTPDNWKKCARPSKRRKAGIS